MAPLAAFALPTLSRSVGALIDWFTLIFFSICGIVIWVVWIAMLTSFPPQPAANVERLLPGLSRTFVILPSVCRAGHAGLGLAGEVACGPPPRRHLEEPGAARGGAALCWLLLTTLWMPALDYARSYAPWSGMWRPWSTGPVP